MIGNAARGAINSNFSDKAQNRFDVGGRVLGDLYSGDWSGAGLELLKSGLLTEFMGKDAAQALFMAMPTPYFGGISPMEAKNLVDDVLRTPRARKNLFLLNVKGLDEADGSGTQFNIFATEVEYSPFILTGDKRKVGGAVIDAVQGNEPTEMRITTLDDEQGTLKRWFARRHAMVVAKDGTVGVPASYAISIKVTHAFITEGTAGNGYADKGLFRPVNMDVSLSRREDGLQELQMSFTQLDTFMS